MAGKDQKTGKMTEIPQKMIAVNRETGELMPLIREKRFYPGEIAKGILEGKEYSPEKELEIVNSSYWDNKLSQLVFYKERGDEMIQTSEPLVREISKDIREGRINPNALTPTQKQAFNTMENADIYLRNAYQSLNSLFNQAYKLS